MLWFNLYPQSLFVFRCWSWRLDLSWAQTITQRGYFCTGEILTLDVEGRYECCFIYNGTLWNSNAWFSIFEQMSGEVWTVKNNKHTWPSHPCIWCSVQMKRGSHSNACNKKRVHQRREQLEHNTLRPTCSAAPDVSTGLDVGAFSS